jgi:hypothetical protein
MSTNKRPACGPFVCARCETASVRIHPVLASLLKDEAENRMPLGHLFRFMLWHSCLRAFLLNREIMMNRTSMALSLFLGFAVVTGSALAVSPSADGVLESTNASGEKEQRAELAYQIVKKWGGHVQEAYAISAKDWSHEMVPLFRASSTEALLRAKKAKTFEAMNKVLLPSTKTSAKASSVKLLGETTNDLVFVPITPCRIIDTRLAGGQIAANTVRSFDVTATTDYAFQGGDATNCSGAGSAGSFAAAAINFTVVTPTAAGYITAFPFLGTQPLASTVNYAPGDIVGNYTVVKLDQGASSNELSVYSFAQTHLVADLVGYFINPVLGELDCQETVSSNITVNAGSTGTGSSPACAVGYTIISGGCTMSTFDGRVVSSRSFPGSNTHFCAFRNESVSSANTGVAYGRCCKLPSGR